MYLHAVLFLFLSWLLLLAQPTEQAKTVTANIADVTSNSFLGTKQPGCPLECGNLSVPYPFGIGAACSFDSNFTINCNNSKPLLGGLEVISISPTQVRVQNVVASQCYGQNWSVPINASGTLNMQTLASSYTYSDTANKFTVVGCDEFGQIQGLTQDDDILVSGCGSVCSSSTVKIDENCTGIGCCQTDIHKGMKGYMVVLSTLDDNRNDQVRSYSKCSYAFMGEQDGFSFHSLSDLLDPTFVNRVPIVLNYAIGNQSCAIAKNSIEYLCTNNTSCTNNRDSSSGGYLCSCEIGYKGNPYLSSGCTDIDECEDDQYLNDCHENATCTNTPGNFSCSCNDHFSGDGRGCTPRASQISVIKLSFA